MYTCLINVNNNCSVHVLQNNVNKTLLKFNWCIYINSGVLLCDFKLIHNSACLNYVLNISNSLHGAA